MWISRRDDEQCCPGDLGVVRPEERVARLRIRRLVHPDWIAFPRKEIFGLLPQSNECGRSSGLSVQRCDDLTPEELRKRSQIHAEQRANRIGDGAQIASVTSLRAIGSDRYQRKIVYVYDDANEVPEHAVIRACDQIAPEEQASIMIELSETFSEVLPA